MSAWSITLSFFGVGITLTHEQKKQWADLKQEKTGPPKSRGRLRARRGLPYRFQRPKWSGFRGSLHSGDVRQVRP